MNYVPKPSTSHCVQGAPAVQVHSASLVQGNRPARLHISLCVSKPLTMACHPADYEQCPCRQAGVSCGHAPATRCATGTTCHSGPPPRPQRRVRIPCSSCTRRWFKDTLPRVRRTVKPWWVQPCYTAIWDLLQQPGFMQQGAPLSIHDLNTGCASHTSHTEISQGWLECTLDAAPPELVSQASHVAECLCVNDAGEFQKCTDGVKAREPRAG